MVKYMFRESLELAKRKFGGYIEEKANFVRVPHAKKQLDVLTGLIGATFEAYGDVGIYDPERLAKVDFLTNPNPNPSPNPNPNPNPNPSPHPEP